MDPADFDDVARATAPALRRLATALTAGDTALADDLVQITLERVYRRWRRIEINNVNAYLKRVLVRAHIDHCRLQWVRREVSADDLPVSPATGDDNQRVLDWDNLLVGLRKLPPGQRRVVVLRYLEDRSVDETARLLGKSEGTVKRAAHDGLKSMRVALLGEDELKLDVEERNAS